MHMLQRSLASHRLRAACIHYGATGSDVEGLLHENLAKGGHRTDDGAGSGILTMQRDAISLYRDVWRYSRMFVWNDETGQPWRDVIRRSARQEFEAARHEADPEVITRLLLVGRDAVMQAKDKFMEKRQQLEEAAVKGGPSEHRGP